MKDLKQPSSAAVGLMRVLWVIILCFYVTVFVSSIPIRFAYLSQPHEDFRVRFITAMMLNTGDFAQMQASGVTATIYAGYIIALDCIQAAFFTLIAVFIFWRKSDDLY